MPPSRNSPSNTLKITTFFISFACIALYAYHADLRCSREEGPEISQCENRYRECAPGYGFEAFGTLESRVAYKISFTCPNRFITTLFGILGFIFTYVLLILSFLLKKEQNTLRTQFVAVGGLALALLVPSSGLMIVDVLREVIRVGYFSANRTYIGFEPFTPLSYLANIVFNLIGITLISFVIYYGSPCEGNSASSSRVSTNPHFSQENETNENSARSVVEYNKRLSIPTTRKSQLFSLGVITLLLSIICLALYCYHAQPHCFSQRGDFSTSECQSGESSLYTPGYAVSISANFSGVDWKASLTCPFRAVTTIFGLLGFVGALILLFLFFKATRGWTFAVLGGHVIALLLSSFGLMIADVVNGAEHAEETEDFVFSPSSYVVNIVFTFTGTVLIGFITLFGDNSKRKADVSVEMASISPDMSQGIEVSDVSSPHISQGNEFSEICGSVIIEANKVPRSKKGYVMF